MLTFCTIAAMLPSMQEPHNLILFTRAAEIIRLILHAQHNGIYISVSVQIFTFKIKTQYCHYTFLRLIFECPSAYCYNVTRWHHFVKHDL